MKHVFGYSLAALFGCFVLNLMDLVLGGCHESIFSNIMEHAFGIMEEFNVWNMRLDVFPTRSDTCLLRVSRSRIWLTQICQKVLVSESIATNDYLDVLRHIFRTSWESLFERHGIF